MNREATPASEAGEDSDGPDTRQHRPGGRLGAVFFVSVALVSLFVVGGAVWPDAFAAVTGTLFDYVVRYSSWFFLLVGNLFLLFVVVLALSRHGRLKLGRRSDEPEFSRGSWFAMIFQAGMGPALIFWGLAEPLSHYVDVPYDLAPPETPGAAQVAIQYTFFHWGAHPWAMYASVGLVVAYFSYRRNEPGLLSPVFRPLLGDRVDGPAGKAIDIMAILAVVFGIAVALAQAGLQLTAGLGETFGVSTGLGAQLLVMGLTTLAFMASASTPLHRGIKWLANISMLMAPLLLVYYFIVGPTIAELNALTQGTGNYLSDLVSMGFRLDAFSPDTAWLGSWTVFYWAWWIAWAPYVGLFMARISRGRTIREFVAATVLVPSLVSMVWIAVFGGAALDLARSGQAPDVAQTVQNNPPVGMFLFIQQYPLATMMSILTLFILWIFFVAGADAGTVVLGELSAGGQRNPRTAIRLMWGALLAGIASILLMTGGLDALQQTAVLAGLPFAIIMVLMCWAFYRHLRRAGGPDTSPRPPDVRHDDGTGPPYAFASASYPSNGERGDAQGPPASGGGW